MPILAWPVLSWLVLSWLVWGWPLLATPARAAETFATVVPERPLVFPRDHGAHPEYRTEWWYITGWLTDADGADLGFQVTFFRVGTGIGADNPSRFAPRQLILAHAAISDPARGRLLHDERSARALAPLVGADSATTRAWIGDWSLALEDGGDDGTPGERYLTRIDSPDFALDLALVPPGPPLLNGRDGFSQKTPDPRTASYYYSRPQLAVSGRLRLDATERSVTGHAWLDHEWSSEILPEQAQGWDWIGINLHAGGSLMAFQMRARDGGALWGAATLRDGDGATRILGPEQVRLRPLRHWTSPRTGTVYPVEWALELDGRPLTLHPLMDDQELDGRRSSGVLYWEGAARLEDDGQEIGRGYLEMTGYWQRPRDL